MALSFVKRVVDNQASKLQLSNKTVGGNRLAMNGIVKEMSKEMIEDLRATFSMFDTVSV